MRIQILLSLLALSLALPVSAVAGKHALLIGIGDYRSSGLKSLEGPATDLAITSDILTRRLGCAPEDIRVLRDAFAQLAATVAPGDFVYIHYSGHGSLTPDLNGDEPSGYDQTWVSFGARAPAAGATPEGLDDFDVLDDEINAWLAPILAHAGPLVFVSDSCHSATVTRGQAPPIRAVPRDEREHPLGRLPVPPHLFKPDAVRIGAARDVQVAGELTVAGLHYGRFTWHWAEALENAGPGTTWDQVFQRAAAGVHEDQDFTQEPQLEGDPRLTILGGELAEPARTVQVRMVRSRGGIVSLAAGELAGVTKGSVFRQRGGVAEPARVKVVKAHAMDSDAELLSGNLVVGDVLEEESHAYPFAAARVFLNADYPEGVDRPLLERIAASIQALPAYVLAGSQAESDLLVYLIRPRRDAAGRPLYSDPAQTLPLAAESRPAEIWVLTAEERPINPVLPLAPSDPEPALRALHGNLRCMARVREVRGLGNKKRIGPGGVPIVLGVKLLVPDPACTAPEECIDAPRLGIRHRVVGPFEPAELAQQGLRPDQLVTFSIENRCSDGDYYVYLLEIAPNGAIAPLFPQSGDTSDTARVPAGTTLDLHDYNGGYAQRLDAPGDWLVKLIATREPIDIRLLEQGGYRRRGGGLNPLERLLVRALEGTRGNITVGTGEWGTLQVMIPVGAAAASDPE